MILQTIKLPFDAGTADTIYTKQGETGRGIWFDLPFLIGEEEIPDYKAEFIAVKPDDTFVIEDATITNHGDGEDLHSVCYLTLPEQVSAAKGTGSYIVKVYDYAHDNDLIYSAAGGLYVDDHLLLDSMIESIAEANGYNFPDDFLTQADLENIIDDTATVTDKTWSSSKISDELSDLEDEFTDVIADLIDDNTTSADSTWSSNKISNELGNIDTGHNYSTTEHVVGKWLDNKPLYEITLEILTTSTAEDYTAVPHGIANVDMIYIEKAFIISPTYTQLLTPYGCTQPSSKFQGLVTPSEFDYVVGSVFTQCPAKVVLRYTKTTD